MSIAPFEVKISPEVITDLKNRLALTRWPDEISGAGWDYGTSRGYLKELADYWQNEFDWPAQEKALNGFNHFKSEVDNFGLHYVYEQGKGPNPLPLVLLHGWPSSFWQMQKIIPLLTDPAAFGGDAADSFDVIALSLPGYGFSEIPDQRGMSMGRMAELLAKLMTDELGYSRFGVRGSDMGAGVIQRLALTNPEVVVGRHLSGTNPLVWNVPENLTEAEKEFVANAQRWSFTEAGYSTQQSSKPQTLAYGLNDSPVGLAGWLVEKFRRWSDCDGDLEKRFSKDELLTNLTIYWATETINASMRLYFETVRDPGQWGYVNVPTGMLMSPKDMFPTPREWAERTGRVDRWTEVDRGGHFLEWEEPELVAEDLRTFFRPLRSAEGYK